jgi:hypothetical protein
LNFVTKTQKTNANSPGAQEFERLALTKMLGALTTKIFSNCAKLLQRAGHTLVTGFCAGLNMLSIPLPTGSTTSSQKRHPSRLHDRAMVSAAGTVASVSGGRTPAAAWLN